MKAFDAILDRSARDNGFDLLASRALSREIDSGLRTQVGERQRLNVASNYFAIACPIMPIGLLGAFLLLEKLDGTTDPAEKLQTHEMARRNGELSQALYIAAMKQKSELEQKKTPLACSRPIEGLLPAGEKRQTKKPREAELLFNGKRSERINGPVLLAKPQTEVGKIVKTKMALEAHLEKLSQEQQDYGTICRVSSRIEMLEKALKRLGC